MLLASQISLALITAQALQTSVAEAGNQGPSETTLLQTSDEDEAYYEMSDIDIIIDDDLYYDQMEDGDVFTKYDPSSCSERGGCGWIYHYEIVETHDIVDLGPWKDTGERALPIFKGNSHSYDSCNNSCTDHKFFALQYNGECFCGDDEKRAKKYGPGNCGKTGGSWCQNIWQRVPKLFKEIGAYKDTGDRALR